MSLPVVSHESVAEMGLDPQRWRRVVTLAGQLVDTGELPALAMQFQHQGRATEVVSLGRMSTQSLEPVTSESCFLIASLTKPILASAVLMLVEEGRIALNQRVFELLPEFSDGPKRPITIRHLLTHTSGLPDMLPHNQKLRRERSPLSRFIEGTCAVSLDFPPGRGSQYQSMGYALLGEIISRVAQVSYGDFLRQRLFLPLGMNNTWLGLPPGLYGNLPVVEVSVPEEQQGGDDWNWNSRYWQEFGAPWGGMVSTASDLSRFLRFCMRGGVGPAGRLLSNAAIQLATANRLYDYEGIPDFERRQRGWGFGWRMNWSDHRFSFGDFVSPGAYGHWGATGTLFWIDPTLDAAAVLLSNAPLGKELSPLTRLSNALIATLK